MQILVQWLKLQNASFGQRMRIYEAFKEPGIKIPKSMVQDICQVIKNILTNKSKRLEGLLLLDLVLDNIPDQILSDHIVFFMKQMLALSGNKKLASGCYSLLHRMILRLDQMPFMQRDVRQDIFKPLMQCITREIANIPASADLLKLTEAVIYYFGKSCGPNRDPMERFLFKQIISGELHDKSSSEALVQTLAALAKSVPDPQTRHDVQTMYLDIMIRSSDMTLKFLTAGQVSEEQLAGTVYGASTSSIIPSGVDNVSVKLVVWKRLLVQLDCVIGLIDSSLTKSIPIERLLKLVDKTLMAGARDEHLVFLNPSLIVKAVSILRALIRTCGDQVALKNNYFASFFLRALDLTLHSNINDLSDLRIDVYDAITDWLRTSPPSSFLKSRSDGLLKILKICSDDLAAASSSSQTNLLCSSLALQRAIILEYGHRKNDHIKEILMTLIPQMIALTMPFSGVFRTNPKCRLGVYELLLAFCINPNTNLLPPTAEIAKRIAEGMFDEDYEIREACKTFNTITTGILDPLECGFQKSYSHALHEHNREAKRLELTRAERTRPAECQTIEGTLYPPLTVTVSTMTDSMKFADIAPRDTSSYSRPGPKSEKERAKRKREEELEFDDDIVEEHQNMDEPMDEDDVIEDEIEDDEDEEDDENIPGEEIDEDEEEEAEYYDDEDDEMPYKKPSHRPDQVQRIYKAREEADETKLQQTAMTSSSAAKSSGASIAPVIIADDSEEDENSPEPKLSQQEEADVDEESNEVKGDSSDPAAGQDTKKALPDSSLNGQSPELEELQPVNSDDPVSNSPSKVNGNSEHIQPKIEEVGPVVVAVASDEEDMAEDTPKLPPPAPPSQSTSSAGEGTVKCSDPAPSVSTDVNPS